MATPSLTRRAARPARSRPGGLQSWQWLPVPPIEAAGKDHKSSSRLREEVWVSQHPAANRIDGKTLHRLPGTGSGSSVGKRGGGRLKRSRKLCPPRASSLLPSPRPPQKKTPNPTSRANPAPALAGSRSPGDARAPGMRSSALRQRGQGSAPKNPPPPSPVPGSFGSQGPIPRGRPTRAEPSAPCEGTRKAEQPQAGGLRNDRTGLDS